MFENVDWNSVAMMSIVALGVCGLLLLLLMIWQKARFDEYCDDVISELGADSVRCFKQYRVKTLWLNKITSKQAAEILRAETP